MNTVVFPNHIYFNKASTFKPKPHILVGDGLNLLHHNRVVIRYGQREAIYRKSVSSHRVKLKCPPLDQDRCACAVATFFCFGSCHQGYSAKMAQIQIKEGEYTSTIYGMVWSIFSFCSVSPNFWMPPHEFTVSIDLMMFVRKTVSEKQLMFIGRLVSVK